MNIQQAKEQIKRAVIAYRSRDPYGRLVIPPYRQRPVFLVGPPGIGKTAIASQVAREMRIGFVSYSITHHTRQSALGLPYIAEREYGGRHYRISEYTMSEIIASVYDQMENTGIKEGILFLDEINCVSETLSPAMLQFLQYKVFGQHQVPEGWVVVTAGNPSAYNRAVHEFDMVTQDRLKRIDIEPDYDTWRTWALQEGIHPAIPAYLDSRPGDFYQVKQTSEGTAFVTPRGWADLSDMLLLYEKNDLPVDDLLLGQYLRNDAVARQFSVFYALWEKYKTKYHIEQILDGKADSEVTERAGSASFDEQTALITLLSDSLGNGMKKILDQRAMLLALKPVLQEAAQETDPAAVWEKNILTCDRKLQQVAVSLPENELRTLSMVRTWLADHRMIPEEAHSSAADRIREAYLAQKRELDEKAAIWKERLEHAICFAEEAFVRQPEMLSLLITDLTIHPETAAFIGRYGSEGYDRHSGMLSLQERRLKLLEEIDEVL